MFNCLWVKEQWWYWIMKIYSIRGQLPLSGDKVNSFVDISKILFQNRVCCHWIVESLSWLNQSVLRPCHLYDISFEGGFSLCKLWFGQWKKWVVVLMFWPQVHIGDTQS